MTDLLETHSGEYWIATSGGLVRFDPHGAPVNHVIYAGDVTNASPLFAVVGPKDVDVRASHVTVLLRGQGWDNLVRDTGGRLQVRPAGWSPDTAIN